MKKEVGVEYYYIKKETPEETNAKIKGNEPAFATTCNDVEYPGLTKREYFAAMAMQGIISGRQSSLNSYIDDYIGKTSVKLADELLKQLSK